MNRIVPYLLFLCLLLLSCHQPYNSRLQDALCLADSNRAELEKVLLRYSSEDSLKYRAAVFLIENMPYYSYLATLCVTRKYGSCTKNR